MDLTPSVMVVGDINIDVVFHLAEYPREGTEGNATASSSRLGGSACTTAALLARLGVVARLAGHLGSDPFGQLARAQITAAGVDGVALDQRAEVASGYMLIAVTPGGQRTMFGFRGCNTLPYDLARLEPLLEGCRLLHLSGYALIEQAQQDSVLALLTAAQARGIRISLDPSLEAARQVRPVLLAALPRIDLLLASEPEALVLAGSADLAGAVSALVGSRPLLALKLGVRGSRVIGPGLDESVPAYAGDTVLDTTGAGDAFNAGFLAAWLRGNPPRQCARAGNALAYLAITQPDGLADLHRLPDLPAALVKLAGPGLSPNP